jgi:hypothetical protein
MVTPRWRPDILWSMTKTTGSADLAAEHGLPGCLRISKHRTQIFVELDIPKHADRIDKKLIPGVEALAIGFLKRLMGRSRLTQQDRTVAVADGYVAAWLHSEDLDHFLIGLAALLDGAAAAGDRSYSDST